MSDENRKTQHDSISAVGPYARIRIIVAVIIIIFAVGVVGYRAFFG